MKMLPAAFVALVCAWGAASLLWIGGAGALAVVSGYVLAGALGLVGALWISSAWKRPGELQVD